MFNINDPVKVVAYTRDGKIVRSESGIGIVRSIRQKYFFVELAKNKRAIKFNLEGIGINCIYKTIATKR